MDCLDKAQLSSSPTGFIPSSVLEDGSAGLRPSAFLLLVQLFLFLLFCFQPPLSWQTSITELKALGKPPRECVDVVAACGFLLKQAQATCDSELRSKRSCEEKRKLDWKGCQKMMQSPQQTLGVR